VLLFFVFFFTSCFFFLFSFSVKQEKRKKENKTKKKKKRKPKRKKEKKKKRKKNGAVPGVSYVHADRDRCALRTDDASTGHRRMVRVVRVAKRCEPEPGDRDHRRSGARFPRAETEVRVVRRAAVQRANGVGGDELHPRRPGGRFRYLVRYI
jgi:hypothetical protein